MFGATLFVLSAVGGAWVLRGVTDDVVVPAFEDGTVEPWATTTSPDLTVLITMALLADRPLLGPPPSETLERPPHGDLARANVAEIGGLLGELDTDTRNVILTLARIWGGQVRVPLARAVV